MKEAVNFDQWKNVGVELRSDFVQIFDVYSGLALRDLRYILNADRFIHSHNGYLQLCVFICRFGYQPELNGDLIWKKEGKTN